MLQSSALFRRLEEELDGVTPEQLALTKPGERAVYGKQHDLGTMPDHLKAILALRDKVARRITNGTDIYRRGDPKKNSMLAVLLIKEMAWADFLNYMFWITLSHEFPSTNQCDLYKISYDSNFHVYTIPLKDGEVITVDCPPDPGYRI